MGLAAVVLGVLVLSSSGARGVGVDPFTNPAGDKDWLDTLRTWNHTREVGATLLVLGLAALAAAGGVLVGRRREPARRVVVLGGVTAGVLLAVGLVAFAWPRPAEVEYVGIYKLVRGPIVMPPPIVFATMVWTRGQAVAAVVAAVGLLLGCGVAGVSAGTGVLARCRGDVGSD